ncbi:UPF0158 family protein [Segetibacter koreensis]|uniref:UPF0158 family protein n=1 Tax=Segetibacter koreensis TaxID=398037 RepID=UPI00037C7C41|nr:UPF0158 family protein [Segetibacter koreensis]
MPTFTKEQIKEISEQLDCGFRAFYHKQTGELIFVPDTNRHIGMDTDAWQDELDKLDENFLDYHEIDAMEASDSFRVMADFVKQLTDTKLKDELIKALSRNRPFREFKFVIDNAGEQRQCWFAFKSKRYIEWTEEQLKMQKDIDEQENVHD